MKKILNKAKEAIFGSSRTSEFAKPDLEHFAWLLSHEPTDEIADFVNSSATSCELPILTQRICAAYRLAHEEYRPSESFWDHSLFDIKADVHCALIGTDTTIAEHILSRPGETAFFWGFDDIAKAPPGETEPHELVIRRLNSSVPWKKLHAMWLTDALNSLAEAVGARRLTYPEMQPSDIGLHYANARQPDQILDEIDATLGVKLSFPNPFPGEKGIGSNRGIVGFRSLQAVYQAWRIYQISEGRRDFRVLEIGGGLGRTAFFARQFGIENYTIVDLPLTNAAQASFLGRTLGETEISLYGEPFVGALRIVPATKLERLGEPYDLIVNVDSLTEMSLETAKAYWNFARRNANAMLSINHEANPFTVQSFRAADNNVKSSRFPYWMRRGYVEEFLWW